LRNAVSKAEVQNLHRREKVLKPNAEGETWRSGQAGEMAVEDLMAMWLLSQMAIKKDGTKTRTGRRGE
jgi:hypothetical protein